MSQGYIVRQMSEVKPVPCPCGMSARAITSQDTNVAGLHLTEIRQDARKHYHRRLTEIYYVLEGTGSMALNRDVVPLSPGTVVMVAPGTRHAARADDVLKVLIFVAPPFDPEDEHFD